MFEDLTKNCQVPVENNRSIKSIIEESESINENFDKYPTVSLPPQMQLGEEGNWYLLPCGFMMIKLLYLNILKEKKLTTLLNLIKIY